MACIPPSSRYSIQELVVLSGAHTLGQKGFGAPLTFNNEYFQLVQDEPWADPTNDMASMIGLPTDKALMKDEETKKWIKVFPWHDLIDTCKSICQI